MGALGATARRRDVDAKPVIGDGSASAWLVEQSATARIVVVGRRGHSRLSHVLLGSVTERVVGAARCPVLVVPIRAEPARLPARVLVGLDLSKRSLDALRAARGIAHDLGASGGLVLGHVRRDERALWLGDWSESQLQPTGEDRDSIRRWLRGTLPEALRAEIRVVDGPAERSLVELAAAERCDWVALGVQGRTALAELLLGSTTQALLKLADRPVLTVPAPRGEAPS